MTYEELSNKLNEITTEDYIWLIYIAIIILSWYSNSLERKYFLNNDLESKEKYRKIIILIFTILIVVYSYFFSSSLNDLTKLTKFDNLEKRKLTELSAIASLLILISGLIFLYIATKDKNIDIELAFN